MKSILMVCYGNICRSPIAEGFFAHQLLNTSQASISITSAGINALINYPAELHAHTVMKKNGMDISKHYARQLSDNLVKQADLILVMTNSHLSHVTRKFITAKGKTFLLGHWNNFEIEDPYKQPYDAFEKVYQQVELTWQEWKTRI